MAGNNQSTNYDVSGELEESLRLSINECLIAPERITVGDVIGAGAFSRVCVPKYTDFDCVFVQLKFIVFFLPFWSIKLK